VRDFTGQIAGALGISGPIWRQAGRAQAARAKALQTAAGRLSAAFGARNGADHPPLQGQGNRI